MSTWLQIEEYVSTSLDYEHFFALFVRTLWNGGISWHFILAKNLACSTVGVVVLACKYRSTFFAWHSWIWLSPGAPDTTVHQQLHGGKWRLEAPYSCLHPTQPDAPNAKWQVSFACLSCATAFVIWTAPYLPCFLGAVWTCKIHLLIATSHGEALWPPTLATSQAWAPQRCLFAWDPMNPIKTTSVVCVKVCIVCCFFVFL